MISTPLHGRAPGFWFFTWGLNGVLRDMSLFMISAWGEFLQRGPFIPVCMSCWLLLSAGGRWLVAWLGLESYVECINETVLACVLIGWNWAFILDGRERLWLAISSTGVLQQVFCMCFDWLELQYAGRFCWVSALRTPALRALVFFYGISGLIFGHLFFVIGSLFFQCVLFYSNVWPCMVFLWEHVPVTVFSVS
jgi:hypothetical protein